YVSARGIFPATDVVARWQVADWRGELLWHRLEHCAHGRGQGRGQRRQHCGMLHAGLVSRLAPGNLLVAAAWPESQPRERLDAAMARGRRGQIPRARIWRRRTPHLWRP